MMGVTKAKPSKIYPYHNNEIKVLGINNQIWLSRGFEIEKEKTEDGFKFKVTEKFYKQLKFL